MNFNNPLTLPYGYERDIYVKIGDMIATARYFPPFKNEPHSVQVWDYNHDNLIWDVTFKINGWAELDFSDGKNIKHIRARANEF